MLDPSNISFLVTLLIKQPPLLYVRDGGAGGAGGALAPPLFSQKIFIN